MRKNKVQFFKIQCKGGCGKEITTTNRSIHGLDSLHAKRVDRLCFSYRFTH